MKGKSMHEELNQGPTTEKEKIEVGR